jgi:hypothetical protein
LESTYQEYKDRGFIIIQLLGENNSGSTPSASDLDGWASTYGVTFPTVADAGWNVTARYERDWGIPSFTLIGPGAEVIETDGWISDADIEAALP